MNIWQALLLGVVQGLTEFFPVSSKGHLALFQTFFGFENLKNLIFFDLIVHLGTLFSIIFVFRKDILKYFLERQKRVQIFFAILPLFPCLLIKSKIEAFFDNFHIMGLFFIITASLIFLSEKFSRKANQIKRPYADSLVIGVFQAGALLPGISRSGSTISGAKLLGWSTQEAVTFSFVLGMVAIVGGVIIKGSSFAAGYETQPVSGLALAAGFTSSFLVGVFALKSLINFATNKNLLPFAWYCLILGFFTLIYFNL